MNKYTFNTYYKYHLQTQHHTQPLVY